VLKIGALLIVSCLIAIDLSWCFNGPETVQSGASTRFEKFLCNFIKRLSLMVLSYKS